ncbi:hypothetical protein BDW74DRAFT_188078 [Aspergillus multicolor]|uniref:DUF3176 domain-containing protein n=1 Tax=Aspergillus multicolor TaxID=41759 RepID=UPI003CCCB2E3
MTAGDTESHGPEPALLLDEDSDRDPGPPSPRFTEYRRHPMYSRSEWLYDTIALVINLNQPLSNWHGPISLTATISLLTTCCSAAMMHSVSQFISQLKWSHFGKGKARKLAQFETFDEASRGPWGSIILPTSVKWNLATLGALIAIFRMSFAPLAQQVVAFSDCDVHTADDSVTFGHTHNFTYPRPAAPRAILAPDSIPQDPGMQAAVLQGVYGIRSVTDFSCPGTCRWNGSYVSLGFRSACTNVTEATLQTESCGVGTNNWKVCNMTTPGGVLVATQGDSSSAGTSYYMDAVSMAKSINSVEDDTLQGSLPEYVRFAIYRSTMDKNFNSVNINITECSLSLSVYEYTNANANGSYFFFDRVREIDFGAKNPWNIERTTVLGSKLWTNATVANDITIPALQINWADPAALGNFSKSPTFVSDVVEGAYENINPGLAPIFSGNADINGPFEGIANSTTEYLRRSPNDLRATGERIDRLTYVQIDWWYLIGPAAIQLMGLLFAGATIFLHRTSRRVPLWKSSALAVLACQHEQQLGIIHSKVKDIKQIEKAAGKAMVRLE